MAMRAVFDSWNTDRARIYRRRERIPQDLGTAVNVCAMVFGNLGETSGTGVCFTRDPATGKQGVYGDYLPNAQGEDVVAGIRNTLSLEDFARLDPSSHGELTRIMRRLETHYRDLCDIEFTVERGKLWMLQTRVGKRTAAAAFRIAIQLVDERLITQDEALHRVTGHQLSQLMFPQFDPDAERSLLTKGMAASPGAAVGEVVFDSATAAARAAQGRSVLLVRRETTPDDLEGMIAATGVLTSRGGKTSHAAVVARGMGRTCVCGAEAIDIDAEARTARVKDVTINEGDVLSIDGSTGEVFLGELPVVAPPVVTYLEDGLDAALEAAEDEGQDLVRAVDRLLRHADRTRRLKVRANADTAEDAGHARRMGAEGIGLTRTEHMFLGERRMLVERLILADGPAEREAALAELLPMQREDFVGLLTAMDGLPTTIRLLDPPLHEFLPDRTELAVRVAVAKATGEPDPADERLLVAVERLHENNAMLGLRGVRLGLVMPGLFAMQVRAIVEAAAQRKRDGGDPRVEIMVPLVGSVMELHLVRDEIDIVVAEASAGVDAGRPDRHDDRAAAGRAHRAADRRVGRVLLVRHQRPHPDDVGLLARRRRGVDLPDLPGQGGVHGVAVRVARPRRRGRAGAHGRRGGPPYPPGHQAGRVRRARRRPGVGALLPRRGRRLRFVFTLPGAGGSPGGRPGCALRRSAKHSRLIGECGSDHIDRHSVGIC